ncbi:MFS general substrate transporter [Aureobasidium sp. EXF-10728]|nr:MFS general substrate transporter [Aureobasidium sp. EXF-10728]
MGSGRRGHVPNFFDHDRKHPHKILWPEILPTTTPHFSDLRSLEAAAPTTLNPAHISCATQMATETITLVGLQTLGCDQSRGTDHVLVSPQENPTPANHALQDAATDDSPTGVLTRNRAVIVIAQLIGLQLFTSFCNGILVVGLPTIASSLHLDASLLIWPTSAFYLTAGSCLMLAGSVTDVIGTRPLILTANMLLVATALGCGLARTGGELVAFRGLQGVCNAMAIPASISVISTSIAKGRPRNLGFACLGFSGPLGFLLGLVLGGVFVDSIGWRSAFYLVTASSFALCGLGFWVLPRNVQLQAGRDRSIRKQLMFDIDWIGTLLVSFGLATISYVLAMLSTDTDNIRKAPNIVLLVLGIACLPSFIYWMSHQVKHERPALIPNALWRDASFTSICVMITFASAAINSMELYSSLFFQQVQGVSAIGASLRILPALVMAVVANIACGYFVNRMPVMWVVVVSCALSAVSPLLMALLRPEWSYWNMAFIAQVLQPLSTDVLFTIGILVISAVFPPRTQALGGAVFNTCSQLGTSIGLTITAVIADSQTAATSSDDLPHDLMVGYRLVFWVLFGWMVLVCLTGAFGLRNIGKIGTKQD